MPQFLIQSIFFVNQNFNFIDFDMSQIYELNLSRLNLLLAVKLLLSSFRISWSSMLFVKYFVVYEFNKQKLSKAFMFCRFLSNHLILLVRFVPFIVLFNYLTNFCYVLLLFKFLFHFLLEAVTFTCNLPRPIKNYFSFLSLFWCMILSMLRTLTYIEEFEMFFKSENRNLNCYLLFYSLFQFFEILLVFYLILSCLDLTFLVICLSVFYIVSMIIEHFYWAYVLNYQPLIRKHLKNWILSQNIEKLNTLNNWDSNMDKEREHFLSI